MSSSSDDEASTSFSITNIANEERKRRGRPSGVVKRPAVRTPASAPGSVKRRGRPPGSGKRRTENAASNANTLPSETNEERVKRFRDTTARMMFAAGDGEYPLDENVDLVLNIVLDELVGVVGRARETAKLQKSSTIECVHIAHEMRRRPDMLSRLLRHAKVLLSIRNVNEAIRERAPSIDAGSGEESEEGEAAAERNEHGDLMESRSQNLPSNYEQHYERIRLAVNALKLDSNAEQIEEMEDLVGGRRAARLASRVDAMDAELYEIFVEARSATLCSMFNVRKSVRDMQSFTAWIGSPRLGPSALFMLTFIAKETVQQLVYFASRVAGDIASVDRRRGNGEQFRPLQESDRRSWESGCSQPLTSSHYRTALLRSAAGRGGDFLFGVVQ